MQGERTGSGQCHAELMQAVRSHGFMYSYHCKKELAGAVSRQLQVFIRSSFEHSAGAIHEECHETHTESMLHLPTSAPTPKASEQQRKLMCSSCRGIGRPMQVERTGAEQLQAELMQAERRQAYMLTQH